MAVTVVVMDTIKHHVQVLYKPMPACISIYVVFFHSGALSCPLSHHYGSIYPTSMGPFWVH